MTLTCAGRTLLANRRPAWHLRDGFTRADGCRACGDSAEEVVRKAERIATGDTSNYLIEALMAGSESRPLAAYIVAPGRTFLNHDVPDHVGQEFLYVPQGKINVAVTDQLIVLGVGDCASYDAALQHKLRRPSSAVPKVLVVLGKN